MAVKYLSEDWANEVTNLFRQSEPLTKAIKGQNFTIQFTLCICCRRTTSRRRRELTWL